MLLKCSKLPALGCNELFFKRGIHQKIKCWFRDSLTANLAITATLPSYKHSAAYLSKVIFLLLNKPF